MQENLSYVNGKLRIVDGDTIVINNQKIRLWGIDAPEMKFVKMNLKKIIIVRKRLEILCRKTT